MIKIINNDSLIALKELSDNSVDAVVCDPPYGIAFMNRKWDYDVPSVEIWKECLRVLKPGGYLLAFAGTRTQHRMAVRIEDAGFEIRDMIAWIYGSGFPKSLNIGKAVDKLQGNERKDLGWHSAHINRPETENWDKSAQEMNHGKSKVEGKQGVWNSTKCKDIITGIEYKSLSEMERATGLIRKTNNFNIRCIR